MGVRNCVGSGILAYLQANKLVFIVSWILSEDTDSGVRGRELH